MSQDNSIAKTLSSPEFNKGLKKLIIDKKVKHALRTVDKTRSGEAKKQVKELVHTHPHLFADLISKGYSRLQIIEHWFRRI